MTATFARNFRAAVEARILAEREERMQAKPTPVTPGAPPCVELETTDEDRIVTEWERSRRAAARRREALAEQIRERGRAARELRAQGLTWPVVAASLGCTQREAHYALGRLTQHETQDQPQDQGAP